jgi:hypothetical protein
MLIHFRSQTGEEVVEIGFRERVKRDFCFVKGDRIEERFGDGANGNKARANQDYIKF